MYFANGGISGTGSFSYPHMHTLFEKGGIPTVSFIGSGPKFDRPSTKKKAFFFEHARMTQTFCKWKRGDMKVRILISCGNTIQTKACVSSFVLFCAILAPN